MFEILSITDTIVPKGKSVFVRYTNGIWMLEYYVLLPENLNNEQINEAIEADFNKWRQTHD